MIMRQGCVVFVGIILNAIISFCGSAISHMVCWVSYSFQRETISPWTHAFKSDFGVAFESQLVSL